MAPLRIKRRESLLTGTALDASSPTKDSRHMQALAELNRRHRELYQGEKPVKRGTDDELPSAYTLAEIQELNRLRREGSTVSLAERVQRLGENVERGRLDEFPADVSPVAIFAKGVWPRRIETLRNLFPEEKYVIREDEDGIKIYDRNEAVEAIHNPEPEQQHSDARDRLIMADGTRDMGERLAAMQRVNHRKWERERTR